MSVKNRPHRTIAQTAVVAAATGFTALALASPASAEKLDKWLSVECPQPLSQDCSPRQGLTVETTGPLFVTFDADKPEPYGKACAAVKARIFMDGQEWGSAIVQPGQNDGGYYIPTYPGQHTIEVQADGVPGGCNTGSMSGWAGNLHVETGDDALNGATP
jgi:hypothetical protein